MQTSPFKMSWFYPSSEEAAESYAYYKRKYDTSASQLRTSEKNEESYRAQKKTANSKLKTASTRRKNFEKRLSGIEKIIESLEGRGGWFSTDVPAAISKASSALQSADESYRKSIRMSGVPAASLSDAFEIKTVEGDSNSASALREYKAEKARLEQGIAELKGKISSLSAEVSSLTSKINACNNVQADLRKTMVSCAFEMQHYKKFM